MDIDIIKRYEAINEQFKKDIKSTIKGEDMADLTTELLKICSEREYFLRDIITGNIKTNLNANGSHIITEEEARNIFYTRFMDKMRLKHYRLVGDEAVATWKPINKQQTDVLFNSIMMYSTYNSRKEFYDEIPDWDGTDRYADFMRKYFKCNAKPEFFWLMMVGIAGKIADPANCYVPYWFDIIGEKGVGKSRFFERLLGKYVTHMHQKSRMDDLYVDLYGNNAVVALDDEGGMVGTKYGQFSYDQWKEFITAQRDTFSRKFCQPETHDRSFITVRTSNESKTVFSISERRQIIFECENERNECYVNDLPDTLYRQLLAQAEAYYNEYGMFKLDDSCRAAIYKQNVKYYNTETKENFYVEQFINEMIAHPTNTYLEDTTRLGMWVSFNSFMRWMKDNYPYKELDAKGLWKAVTAVYNQTCTIYFDKNKTKIRPRNCTNPVNMFKILEARERRELEQKRKEEGLIGE